MVISSRSIIPISGNALLNQFPDLASAGADAAAATAELQAAFDQLAGGDINAVSNFELRMPSAIIPWPQQRFKRS